MLENLKTELIQFMSDIEENLKSKEDIVYTKNRANKLVDVMLKTLNDVIDFEEQKLLDVVEKTKNNELKIEELTKKVNNIYQDIYDEEDAIVIDCPYCGTKFEADIDEEFNEIKCPECKNEIELDWSGNVDETPDNKCGGNCSHCGECE